MSDQRVRRSAALAASVALTRTKPADVPHALRQFKPPARKRTRAPPAGTTQSPRQEQLESPTKKRAKPSNREQQKHCAGSKSTGKRKCDPEPFASIDQLRDRSSSAAAAPAAEASSGAVGMDGGSAASAAAGGSAQMPKTAAGGGGVADAADVAADVAADAVDAADADAAAAAAAAAAVAAAARPRARALPSPLPGMVITPGLREAVDASRSRHETAFAAEKRVRVRPVPWIAHKHRRVKRRCAMLAQFSLQRACDWAQRLPPANSSLPVSHAVATPSGAGRSFIAHGTAALA